MKPPESAAPTPLAATSLEGVPFERAAFEPVPLQRMDGAGRAWAARTSPRTRIAEGGAPESALAGFDAAELALQMNKRVHLPGVRDARRVYLVAAMAALEQALGDAHAAMAGAAPWVDVCRRQLANVYACNAEDARYGAGQLSRSAQRAPTEGDCDDGWRRVEEIVCGAEGAAVKALELADQDGTATARQLAESTVRAAKAARQIVVGRNLAYTFHTDPAFSFGEGWYAAAAAVLAGVRLQLEPGQRFTAAGERFLLDCGLAGQLDPYRGRPRANKALPGVIADVFRRDPTAAQARLRAAFLRETPGVATVRPWLEARLGEAADPAFTRDALRRSSVLVWVRQGTHDPHRNSSGEELHALCALAQRRGLRPILIGDGIAAAPAGALDLTLFWKAPIFQGVHMRRAQLELFELLRSEWGLVGQVGVTTAGMDGPALLGLPTVYLTEKPNVRLGRWVGAVPNYHELVRGADTNDRLARRFAIWATHK